MASRRVWQSGGVLDWDAEIEEELQKLDFNLEFEGQNAGTDPQASTEGEAATFEELVAEMEGEPEGEPEGEGGVGPKMTDTQQEIMEEEGARARAFAEMQSRRKAEDFFAAQEAAAGARENEGGIFRAGVSGYHVDVEEEEEAAEEEEEEEDTEEAEEEGEAPAEELIAVVQEEEGGEAAAEELVAAAEEEGEFDGPAAKQAWRDSGGIEQAAGASGGEPFESSLGGPASSRIPEKEGGRDELLSLIRMLEVGVDDTEYENVKGEFVDLEGRVMAMRRLPSDEKKTVAILKNVTPIMVDTEKEYGEYVEGKIYETYEGMKHYEQTKANFDDWKRKLDDFSTEHLKRDMLSPDVATSLQRIIAETKEMHVRYLEQNSDIIIRLRRVVIDCQRYMTYFKLSGGLQEKYAEVKGLLETASDYYKEYDVDRDVKRGREKLASYNLFLEMSRGSSEDVIAHGHGQTLTVGFFIADLNRHCAEYPECVSAMQRNFSECRSKHGRISTKYGHWVGALRGIEGHELEKEISSDLDKFLGAFIPFFKFNMDANYKKSQIAREISLLDGYFDALFSESTDGGVGTVGSGGESGRPGGGGGPGRPGGGGGSGGGDRPGGGGGRPDGGGGPGRPSGGGGGGGGRPDGGGGPGRPGGGGGGGGGRPDGGGGPGRPGGGGGGGGPGGGGGGGGPGRPGGSGGGSGGGGGGPGDGAGSVQSDDDYAQEIVDHVNAHFQDTHITHGRVVSIELAVSEIVAEMIRRRRILHDIVGILKKLQDVSNFEKNATKEFLVNDLRKLTVYSMYNIERIQRMSEADLFKLFSDYYFVFAQDQLYFKKYEQMQIDHPGTSPNNILTYGADIFFSMGAFALAPYSERKEQWISLIISQELMTILFSSYRENIANEKIKYDAEMFELIPTRIVGCFVKQGFVKLVSSPRKIYVDAVDAFMSKTEERVDLSDPNREKKVARLMQCECIHVKLNQEPWTAMTADLYCNLFVETLKRVCEHYWNNPIYSNSDAINVSLLGFFHIFESNVIGSSDRMFVNEQTMIKIITNYLRQVFVFPIELRVDELEYVLKKMYFYCQYFIKVNNISRNQFSKFNDLIYVSFHVLFPYFNKNILSIFQALYAGDMNIGLIKNDITDLIKIPANTEIDVIKSMEIILKDYSKIEEFRIYERCMDLIQGAYATHNLAEYTRDKDAVLRALAANFSFVERLDDIPRATDKLHDYQAVLAPLKETLDAMTKLGSRQLASKVATVIENVSLNHKGVFSARNHEDRIRQLAVFRQYMVEDSADKRMTKYVLELVKNFGKIEHHMSSADGRGPPVTACTVALRTASSVTDFMYKYYRSDFLNRTDALIKQILQEYMKHIYQLSDFCTQVLFDVDDHHLCLVSEFIRANMPRVLDVVALCRLEERIIGDCAEDDFVETDRIIRESYINSMRPAPPSARVGSPRTAAAPPGRTSPVRAGSPGPTPPPPTRTTAPPLPAQQPPPGGHATDTTGSRLEWPAGASYEVTTVDFSRDGYITAKNKLLLEFNQFQHLDDIQLHIFKDVIEKNARGYGEFVTILLKMLDVVDMDQLADTFRNHMEHLVRYNPTFVRMKGDSSDDFKTFIESFNKDSSLMSMTLYRFSGKCAYFLETGSRSKTMNLIDYWKFAEVGLKFLVRFENDTGFTSNPYYADEIRDFYQPMRAIIQGMCLIPRLYIILLNKLRTKSQTRTPVEFGDTLNGLVKTIVTVRASNIDYLLDFIDMFRKDDGTLAWDEAKFKTNIAAGEKSVAQSDFEIPDDGLYMEYIESLLREKIREVKLSVDNFKRNRWGPADNFYSPLYRDELNGLDGEIDTTSFFSETTVTDHIIDVCVSSLALLTHGYRYILVENDRKERKIEQIQLGKIMDDFNARIEKLLKVLIKNDMDEYGTYMHHNDLRTFCAMVFRQMTLDTCFNGVYVLCEHIQKNHELFFDGDFEPIDRMENLEGVVFECCEQMTAFFDAQNTYVQDRETAYLRGSELETARTIENFEKCHNLRKEYENSLNKLVDIMLLLSAIPPDKLGDLEKSEYDTAKDDVVASRNRSFREYKILEADLSISEQKLEEGKLFAAIESCNTLKTVLLWNSECASFNHEAPSFLKMIYARIPQLEKVLQELNTWRDPVVTARTIASYSRAYSSVPDLHELMRNALREFLNAFVKLTNVPDLIETIFSNLRLAKAGFSDYSRMIYIILACEVFSSVEPRLVNLTSSQLFAEVTETIRLPLEFQDLDAVILECEQKFRKDQQAAVDTLDPQFSYNSTTLLELKSYADDPVKRKDLENLSQDMLKVARQLASESNHISNSAVRDRMIALHTSLAAVSTVVEYMKLLKDRLELQEQALKQEKEELEVHVIINSMGMAGAVGTSSVAGAAAYAAAVATAAFFAGAAGGAGAGGLSATAINFADEVKICVDAANSAMSYNFRTAILAATKAAVGPDASGSRAGLIATVVTAAADAAAGTAAAAGSGWVGPGGAVPPPGTTGPGPGPAPGTGGAGPGPAPGTGGPGPGPGPGTTGPLPGGAAGAATAAANAALLTALRRNQAENTALRAYITTLQDWGRTLQAHAQEDYAIAQKIREFYGAGYVFQAPAAMYARAQMPPAPP